MNDFSIFLDLKMLVFVIAGSIGLSLVSFSFGEILKGLKHGLNGSRGSGEELEVSRRLWLSTARNFVIFGILGGVLGFVKFFSIIGSSQGLVTLGLYLSISFQAILYGIALATVSLILLVRVKNKIRNIAKVVDEPKPLEKSHSRLNSILGYFIMLSGFFVVFAGFQKLDIFVHIFSFALLIVGTLIIYFFTGDKGSVSISLCCLGLMVVLLGICQMFFAFGNHTLGIKGVSNAMLMILVSLIYVMIFKKSVQMPSSLTFQTL